VTPNPYEERYGLQHKGDELKVRGKGTEGLISIETPIKRAFQGISEQMKQTSTHQQRPVNSKSQQSEYTNPNTNHQQFSYQSLQSQNQSQSNQSHSNYNQSYSQTQSVKSYSHQSNDGGQSMIS
jgi:hypothetical protein